MGEVKNQGHIVGSTFYYDVKWNFQSQPIKNPELDQVRSQVYATHSWPNYDSISMLRKIDAWNVICKISPARNYKDLMERIMLFYLLVKL